MARTSSLACLLLLALGGCAQPLPPDQRFGMAARGIKQLQYLDPAAGAVAMAPAGLDGASARSVIQRYRKGFEKPQPAVNVLNIGGSLSGSNINAAANQ